MNNVDYFCRKCIVSTSLCLTHVKKLTKFDLYMSMHEMKLIYLLFLFFSLTFKKVLQKKNIEGFSCIPYIMAMFNCLLYTWYGLPVVSRGWENFPLITINGLGIFLELSFVSIYLRFASIKQKASEVDS